MNAEIITIGDELLIGQVVNTNAAYLARKLNAVGIAVSRMVTVSDNDDEILDAFRDGFDRADLTLVTGGLGPTHDDITKNVLCKFFGTDLAMNGKVLEKIRSNLLKRNLLISRKTEEQALVPRSAKIIPNNVGQAPGLLFEQEGKIMIAMPGVPFEMERMMDETVLPFLQAKSPVKILHRTLNLTGIAESLLADKLGDPSEFLHGAKLAFLPSPLGVRLRISVSAGDSRRAEKMVVDVESYIRAKIEKHIYSVDDETMEESLGKVLMTRMLTLSVAESCTGGLIAHRLTNIPGSSAYFERGVVAYSNQSKIELLRIAPELIQEHGAVSKEVAEAMACGVREISKSHIGISTTGIAGPSGGSPEKPVGLVWIGYADAEETFALKLYLSHDRLRVKERAVQAALELVRRRVLKVE